MTTLDGITKTLCSRDLSPEPTAVRPIYYRPRPLTHRTNRTVACTGVLWDQTIANSSEVVTELGKSASAPYPNLPSSLWVGMHPFGDPGAPRVGVVTIGLRKFVGREIKFERQVAQFKSPLPTASGVVTYRLKTVPTCKTDIRLDCQYTSVSQYA